MVDEKMEPAVAKELLKGEADPLNSAFRLTYNMVHNLLRLEEVQPEWMLERSFMQFQQAMALPALRRALADVEARRDAVVVREEAAVSEVLIAGAL